MIVGGCCLAGGMNYYNGLIIPFVVQSLLFPYNLTQNPLYKVPAHRMWPPPPSTESVRGRGIPARGIPAAARRCACPLAC